MNIISKINEKKYLKQIEPLVEQRLIELGLLKVENGKKELAFGAITTKWEIQKELMKEKHNIDWKSPQDKNPNTFFD